MPAPFLSIIVPVYNVKSYLADCLDSILTQTFTDFEVLLIDDGSSDGSETLCDNYAAKDRRIRCLHKENGGHMSARQEGFRQAQGTYITFVDSDDWIAPAMYERMCGAAKAYGADMVCCNSTAVTPKGNIERRDLCKPGFYKKQMLEEQIYPTMLYSGTFFHYGISPHLWNKLFRRTLLQKHIDNVPLSIKLGEDTLITYPCLLEADSVYFMEESYYRYRSNSSSLTHYMDNSRLAENRLLFDTLGRALSRPCMERQLWYFCAYQCLLTLPPLFGKRLDEKQNFRKDFLAQCICPPIRQAFFSIKIGDISGLHNKAYAFCIRHRFYRLFRFLLKH